MTRNGRAAECQHSATGHMYSSVNDKPTNESSSMHASSRQFDDASTTTKASTSTMSCCICCDNVIMNANNTGDKNSERTRRLSEFQSIYTCFFVILMTTTVFEFCDAAPMINRMIELDQLVALRKGSENTTNFRELSRNAFLSLKGTPTEARLPAYHIENDNKNENDQHTSIRHLRRKNNHTNSHHRKHHSLKGKNGNYVLDGRKQALLQLADPNALKMTQKCDGQMFKQRVRVEGCLTKVIINRLCHGTCASYFIPRMHSKKLKAAFKSCATCAPSDYDFVDITLDCPGQSTPTVTRTVIKVKSCKCREISISSLYE